MTGTTSKGFQFTINENTLDNMELVDALAELEDGNFLVVSKVLTLLIGKEQKKALYDLLRREDGTVPVKDVSDAITEILQSSEELKNS